MSKARKEALKWLPKLKDGRKRYYQCNDDDIRSIYAKGYRKAEKDLELTWEDMHIIAIIEDKLIHELCLNDQSLPQTQEFYEEVLKRFKERKDK